MADYDIIDSFKKKYPKSKVSIGNKPNAFTGQINYTKKFIDFNKKAIKQGLTNNVAFGNNILYNKDTDKFVFKDRYYKQNGGVREKYNNNDFMVDGDTFSRPSIYVEKEIRPLIIQAEQSKESVEIPFDLEKMNDNVDFLLNKVKPTTTMNYFIVTDDTWYALNHATIKNLREVMKPDFEWTSEYDSAYQVYTGMKGGGGGHLHIRMPGKSAVNGGKFFKYTHKLVDKIQNKRINFDKYGVFTEVKAKNYEVNCLCASFEAAGFDITAIKHFVRNQEIPMRVLGQVADKLGVYITVRKIEDKSNLKHYGDKTKPRIELGLIDKHYFLIEKIPYTSFAIKNFEKIKDKENFNKIYAIQNGKIKRKNNQFITSYQAIKILMDYKDTHLTPIEHTGELYKTNYHTKIDDVFNDLSFNDEIQRTRYFKNAKGEKDSEFIEGDLKINKPSSPRDNTCLDTYYFDFETTTRRSDKTATNHKPYCVYTERHRNGFFGENCGKKLLDDILRNHGVKVDEEEEDEENKDKPFVRLIAHNSAYDFRFILKYLSRVDTIEKGTGLMNCNARYYNYGKFIDIQIRDSLKMINMPLAKFGSAFKLDVKKEIMPYDLYTEENVDKVWIPVNECLDEVRKAGLNTEEYLKICKSWDCISNGLINILTYAGEYCYLDCIVLKQGFEKFAELVEEAIGENINDYVSLASMAHNYLIKEGCYDDVLQVAGVPRAFIQKCVVGGRTMMSDNKKSLNFEKYSHKKFSDFDAVSLYPSAMTRMPGFLKGRPKIIKNFQPEKYDGYFVCIKVKSITKKYKFPCVSLLTDKGIRNFTNDLEGEYLYLDKVGLEDFVKYHGAKYEFINGYYYDEGHNPKIKSVMTHLFNQRLKYKKEKNPIQLVFKELMNSSYGKASLKPIDSDSKYVEADKFNDYMDRNFNYIKEATKLANGMGYKVKYYKPIDSHFNNVHVGVEILSMSKRIMYEVMTLAEDLGIIMTYTDTDSIHIDSSRIDELSSEFHKKYGRELIGKNMGQFHTDFDMKDKNGKDRNINKDGSSNDIFAVDSIWLAKKTYIDKLESIGMDDKGEPITIYDYHIRMKGVPCDCIVYKADHEYGGEKDEDGKIIKGSGDLMALFKDLYDGKEITFNLLAVKPKFEMCKNMTIISRTKFDRKIKF